MQYVISVIQAYKNKSQYKLEIDACEKEVSRGSSKRSHNAMEEIDLTNDEGLMDVCASKSEDHKVDGILCNSLPLFTTL